MNIRLRLTPRNIVRSLLLLLSMVVIVAFDWAQFNGNPQHSGDNTQEKMITPATVKNLKQLFKISLPDVADGAPAFLSGVNTSSGIKNLVFVTTRSGYIVALDAATGNQIWSHRVTGVQYTTSSPAVDPNRQYVYSYGLDGNVHKYQVGNGIEITNGGWPELATLKPLVEKESSALSIATAKNGVSYL